MRRSERALVEQRDVRVPPAALHDDALGVGAEHLAPVGGTADAEALAPELARVELEGGGHALGEGAGVVSVPHRTRTAGEEGARRELARSAADSGRRSAGGCLPCHDDGIIHA